MTAADRPSSRGAVRRRLRLGAVVGGLVIALLIGVLIWHARNGDTYVVPSTLTGTGRPAAEQPGEASAALAAWQQAIAERRPDEAPGAAARTATENAARLRVADFTARYVAPAGAVAADGSWTADVTLTWRFAGVDAATATEDVGVTFRPVGGGSGVEISAFGGADDRLPIWLSGPVEVRRTAEVTAVVAGSGAGVAREAQRYRDLATRAVATVRRVLPWPHPGLVLEVPAGQAGVEQMIGAPEGSYHGVAAVTATVDGSAHGPVHVLVNPQVIGGLNSQGAQIVLSHEATHAATDVATNDTMPSWLVEGFADYVALRDVPLPLSTTARQIIAEVRQDGAPRHLPGKAEFNDQADTFGAEYEASWLACRLLARIAGEPALVRLYDDVRDGAPLDATMRRQAAMSVATFTARWRQELVGLAR